jgi:hypothetical protein
LTRWMRCPYRTASKEATWRDGWDVRTRRSQGKELFSFTIYNLLV